MEPRPTLAEARRALERHWGYQDFRWAQRRVVVGALQGRDVLAVLPTGGGKSICYQIPALTLPGTTVVVSPLISLMQDQVAALRRRKVAAQYLSSSQSAAQRGEAWSALSEGRLKLLYLAPERLGQLMERVPRLRIPLLAVDEAHCISEWGHDFRPHYRSLGKHRAALGSQPTIALTGSATDHTRSDIIRTLRMRRPVVCINTFDRPNLYFAVRRFADEASRLSAAIARLRETTDGTAIVYVPTRNRTDGVAAVLRRRGVRAEPYHAGLPSRDRARLLSQFLDGSARVMVATNAFGMGIDQPNVRLVLHLGVPTRPEAYYQEAGRAGRDGNPSRCELLWIRDDLRVTAAMAAPSDELRVGGAPSHLRARRLGLRTMHKYVSTRGCRRRILLGYFGERLRVCEACDRCRPE